MIIYEFIWQLKFARNIMHAILMIQDIHIYWFHVVHV